MNNQLRRLLFSFVLLAGHQLVADSQLPLITQAHAHNDYVHTHPLFDALDNGFCSVEADVFLVDGKLLVAHEVGKVRPESTLEALYLDPLRERVKRNGGRVYANGPEFNLLIELKQDWQVAYPALRSALKNYSDVLVSFSGGTKQTNAIVVIITGHRDEAMFAGEAVRYAALDGQLNDLDSNRPATLVPWISANWRDSFYWNGTGAIPDPELQKLRAIVNRAHTQGRRVRFWNAPDNPNFWQAMHVAGVDLINTDDLSGVQKFFGEANKISVGRAL